MHIGYWRGKPEGKGLLVSPKRRWVDIKMNLREIGWGGREGSCEHGIEPSGSMQYWKVLE
jgi:hypothetical protein